MILPVLLLAAAQPAATETNDADFRCVTVIAAVAPSMPEAQRSGAMAGVMYFFGKIEGRAPAFDYSASAKRAEARFKDQAFAQAELQRCGTTMQTRGKFLQDLGQQMQGK